MNKTEQSCPYDWGEIKIKRINKQSMGYVRSCQVKASYGDVPSSISLSLFSKIFPIFSFLLKVQLLFLQSSLNFQIHRKWKQPQESFSRFLSPYLPFTSICTYSVYQPINIDEFYMLLSKCHLYICALDPFL